MKKILIVDDQPAMLANLTEVFTDEGFEADTASNGEEALEKCENNSYDCILLDINLPRIDGLTVLQRLKESGNSSPVIIFTAYGSSDKTIRAMKLGAFDYLDKPFDLEELLLLVQRAVKYHDIVNELQSLKSRMSSADVFRQDLVGNSPKMREIFKLIGKAAPSEVTVLIQGESGTGKELIADAIHRHSLRANYPFIKVNCAALPLPLLESELFGHEKGAFTDAIAQKKGRFELADKGTILLDEIGEISMELQSKLLRVIQNKTFERVGGKETIKCDVRIIASTNRDLKAAVKEGTFREDLFDRLNVITIDVPPLREHRDDIKSLIDHFLVKYSSDPEKAAVITDDALRLLLEREWTGNIRELENAIQRSLVLSDGNYITKDDLSFLEDAGEFEGSADNGNGLIPMKQMVADLERKLILSALKKTDGHKSKAADLLGINRRVLFNKIKELGIES